MRENAKERRKAKRSASVISLDFTSAGDFLDNFLGNISSGGLLVKAKKPLKENERFSLKFKIEGLEKSFATQCQVMWVQELYDKDLGKMIPVMGCRFLRIDDADMQLIEKFVADRLRQIT